LQSARAILAAALVAWIGIGAAAWGESGRVHVAMGAGLRVTFDATWVFGTGYRPVRIDIQPTAPATTDRTVTVVIHAGQTSSERFDVVAMEAIEVPQGAGRVEAVVSIPPSAAVDYRIQVFEDGDEVPSLSQPVSTSYDAWNQTTGLFPRILVVSNNAPDTRALSEALLAGVDLNRLYIPGMVSRVPSGGGTATRVVPPLWSVISRPRTELPRRWIDLTSLDIVCIPLDDLAWLQARETAAFRALVEWTSAGGNLVVSGVGDQGERLGELESLLRLEPQTGKTGSKPWGWREPDRTHFNSPLPGARFLPAPPVLAPEKVAPAAIQSMVAQPSALPDDVVFLGPDGQSVGPQAGSPAAPGAKAPSPPAPPAKSPFRLRSYNLGLVVAMGPADAFQASRHEWNWLLNAIGFERWQWDRRHGLSLVEYNPDFFNFLIPGVGLAPVLSFEVLITLFVLAVGPVNYFLLRRWKRLHLLVVTVPASAAAVTLALFAYAILADGLGTRVLVRSLTRIDQRQRQAVCWTRLSYYAGLAPSGGMRFPSDVMVVPYEASPGDRAEGTFRGRTLVWEADGQWMRSGWLRSRTPTQLLTVRARPTAIGVEIAGSDSGGMEARNRLGTRVDYLLVRAEDGRYLAARNIEIGQAAALEPVDPATGVEPIRTASGALDPTVPKQGTSARQWTTGYSRRRWNPYPGYNLFGASIGPPPTSRTSRMESAIAVVCGQTAGPNDCLEPGSYVAIVERSPEVELGIPAVKEERGTHVVIGAW
jgi:hypothetical protein